MRLTKDFDVREEAEEFVETIGTGIVGVTGDEFFVKFDPSAVSAQHIDQWLGLALNSRYASVYGWSYTANVTIGNGYHNDETRYAVSKQKNNTYTVSMIESGGESNVVAIIDSEDKLVEYFKARAREYFGL